MSEDSAKNYHISKRAAENYAVSGHWRSFEQALSNPWNQTQNPKGIINLGVAENVLMHPEVLEHFHNNLTIDPHLHLTYGTGPRGSARLRKALASFFESHLHARHEVRPEHFVCVSGVTAVTDLLTWCVCDEGEGIMIPQPLYTAFKIDVPYRARGVMVPVSYQGIEGFKTLDDVFDPKVNERAFERALDEARQKGIRIRGVIICNPHNPLGKCYPVETMKTIASFCGRNKLHLLSDEIYAYSVFSNPAAPDATKFESVLSMDLDDLIDPLLVQVMYGMSKDFCANGTRLGVFYSRNEGLLGAATTVAPFSWPPHMLQDLWASMLEDKKFLNKLFEENQRRMAEKYVLASTILDKYRLSYYRGGNAGVFIWADFRPYMLSKSNSNTDDLSHVIDKLKSTSLDAEQYKKRETDIVSRCMENGIFIGYGSNFFTEELGWFRITFTASEAALEEGLARVYKSLEQIRME